MLFCFAAVCLLAGAWQFAIALSIFAILVSGL